MPANFNRATAGATVHDSPTLRSYGRSYENELLVGLSKY